MVSSRHPSFPKLLRPGYSKGVLYIGNIIPEVRDFIKSNPDYPIVTINENLPLLRDLRLQDRDSDHFPASCRAGTPPYIAVRRSNEEYDQHRQIAEAIAEAQKLYDIRIQTTISTLEENARTRSVKWIGSVLSSDDPPTAILFGGIRCVEIAIHENSDTRTANPG